MKGLTEKLRPFTIGGGRLSLKTMVTFLKNQVKDPKEVGYNDPLEELISRDITSFLNSEDFYSVGDGMFCYIDDMTEEEIRNTATKFDSTGHTYIKKAEKMLGQIYINLDTMKYEIPEPVVIGGE